jgi:hypothetical protein
VRVLAEQRLVDLRRVAEGAGRDAVQGLQRLRTVVVDQRGSELVEEDLQVLAGVGLEGAGQDLVELDGVGRLLRRERVVGVVDLGRRRAAGLDVDEQVALEE